MSWKKILCCEKSCTGIITHSSQKVLVPAPFQTFSTTVACPICHRLYWIKEGIPLQTRRFEKVFFIDGTLKYGPLEASLRLSSTVWFITEDAKKIMPLDFYSKQLKLLAGLNHSPDCLGLTKSDCCCGKVLAQKWVQENPNL